MHTRGRRIGTQNGVTRDAAGGISAGAALLERIAHGEGLSKAAMVELRGLEPLTSSMPWWPRQRRRRAASVVGVHRRAGAATSVRPGSPSVCPSRDRQLEFLRDDDALTQLAAEKRGFELT